MEDCLRTGKGTANH